MQNENDAYAYEEIGKAIDPKGFIAAYLHNRDALKFVSFSSEDQTHGYFEIDPAAVTEERHVKNLIVTNASKFMGKRMRPNTAIANPTSAPLLATVSTGGSLPAGTYFVTYTWVNINGETMVSPEASIVTTGATSTVTVNLPALPAGATSVNVYFGTTTGTGTRQGSTTTTMYVQSAALSTQAPTANTLTVSSPTAAPTLATATTGGSLAAATYYVKYTWVNANGETMVSPEASMVTTGTTSTLTVTLPALPAGATSANVYISTATNTETKQGTTATTSYVQTAALAAGAAVPTANTCVLSNPAAAPTLSTATTGGSLPAATYYAKYTWVNANGETMVSPEASIVATGSTSTITVTVPALPAGATSANVYISTATNVETKQGNTTGTTFIQSSILLSGAIKPSVPTCTITWGAGISHLEVGTGVGTGTTQAPQAENSAQTLLRVALGRKAITSWTCLDVNGAPTAADTNVLQLTTTFIEAEANGAIVEMGLFGGDATVTLNSGQMFNYKAFPVLNKDNTMQLTLVWKLTF